MNEDTYIKLYRKLTKWKYYKKSTYIHLLVHIIIKARVTDWYNINGQLVKRGELDYSIRQLSQETGINRNTVQRILESLISECVIETVHKGKNPKDLSIISIVNYNDYQKKFREQDGDRDSSETVERQQRDSSETTLKNDKNVKNDNSHFSEKNDTTQKKPKSKKPIKYESEINEIINYYNSTLNKNLRASTKSYIKLISDLLDDNYTVTDIKTVIDKKKITWLNNPTMVNYLRPSTLFIPCHFDEYLNESISEEQKSLQRSVNFLKKLDEDF